MPRRSVLLALVAAVLVGLALAGPGRAVAQDATPAAEEDFQTPEGVTFEPLGFGPAEELPAAPALLVLVRATIEPGAGFDVGEDDASVALVHVESGALTVRLEAPMRVLRAAAVAAFATPGAVEEGDEPAFEEVAAGTEATLEAGDSVVLPPNVAGELRNDGAEPAVLLGAIVEPTGAGGATPAASPAA